MAGIYVHIPFCRSRCVYCGFYSTVGLELRQRYTDALCREWELRKDELKEPLDTIYLGGGTPSQLECEQLVRLFDVLPSGATEITLEMNPDDATLPYVTELSQLPVNRISMGAQTFDDERLHFLHRRHTARQVAQAVNTLRETGFQNISIDLMYGFPGETLNDWKSDIDTAISLNVEHISAYCLMIEEGTPLHRWSMENGQWTMDEELEREMYELLVDKLEAAGYEHYEISNFAQPGCRSRHNSSYWHDVPYIGLGAAAHSYDRRSRQWNVADIHQYMESIERGIIPCECEVLDDNTRYNDRITVALRTSDGLDLSTLSDYHRNYCLREAQKYLADGLLRQDGSRLVLTRRGLFVSDMIMAGLILV